MSRKNSNRRKRSNRSKKFRGVVGPRWDYTKGKLEDLKEKYMTEPRILSTLEGMLEGLMRMEENVKEKTEEIRARLASLEAQVETEKTLFTEVLEQLQDAFANYKNDTALEVRDASASGGTTFDALNTPLPLQGASGGRVSSRL